MQHHQCNEHANKLSTGRNVFAGQEMPFSHTGHQARCNDNLRSGDQGGWQEIDRSYLLGECIDERMDERMGA
eukprot:scaffold664724_cov57-Prasinocladus_malaysianus.AAC.1